MGNRRKRTPLGQPLPPANDLEFDAETMRQWAHNQAKVHAEKFGSAEFNALLDAQIPEDEELIP